MRIIHIDFPDEEIQEWCDYLKLWLPEQTPQLVKETIEMFPDEGGKWIVESSHRLAFETSEREMYMTLWAKRNIGMDFPTYGHSPEVQKEFSRRMVELREIDKAIEKLQKPIL